MARHIVITYPETLQSHGGGTVGCVEIARHLCRLGVQVTLVPVQRGPQVGPRRVEGRVVSVKANGLHHLLDGVSLPQQLRDLAASTRIDAVLGWSTEAAFLPAAALRYAGIFGMIAAFPSYELWMSRSTSWRQLKRLSDYWFRVRPLRRADIVFALSNFTKRELVSVLGVQAERVVVTHWGVDERFHRIPRFPRPTIRRLIFYGSLAPLKGVFDAIEALGRVAAAGMRNWELRVAGWGDEAAVRTAAKRHGIEARLTLLGAISHDELAAQLEWADMAVLPTHADSFGLAIAEAQASGLPVVSCDVCAVPEVVASGSTGWLVRARHPERLAEAIVEAMSDPAETFRKGLAGRERIVKRFRWERTAQSMLRAIEDRIEAMKR